MKLVVAVSAILLSTFCAYAQSGRRISENKTSLPAQTDVVTESHAKAAALHETTPAITVRKQDYRCVLDRRPERILESEEIERLVWTKGIDSRVKMTAKPRPTYTKEARRLRIQGFVTLRVLLSAEGTIPLVRVMKGLRAGLTENAIRAACRIEFKPAMKTGQPVAQWLTAEYIFRLADSSIFAP